MHQSLEYHRPAYVRGEKILRTRSETHHTPNNVTGGKEKKKIVDTKGYVSRERKKDERNL